MTQLEKTFTGSCKICGAEVIFREGIIISTISGKHILCWQCFRNAFYAAKEKRQVISHGQVQAVATA